MVFFLCQYFTKFVEIQLSLRKIILLVFILTTLTFCHKGKDSAIEDNQLSDSVKYYFKELQSNQNNYKKKKKDLSRISFLLNQSPNNSVYIRNQYYRLINIYFETGNWQGSYKTSDRLLKQSLKANDTANIAQAYRSFGNYHYYYSGSVDSSFYYFNKAEKYFKQLNDLENYSTILLKKGLLEYDINSFLSSDLTLTNAYIVSKKLDDYPKMHVILNQLGLVANQLKEYNQAIDYFNQALQIIRDNPKDYKQNQEAICLSNLGSVYEALKDYKAAIYYYKLSLKDGNLEKKNPSLYANIIDFIGNCQLQIPDFTNLPSLFEEALQIRKEQKEPSAIVLSYIHLSEFYQKTKNSERALEYATKANRVARKSKTAIDVLNSVKQLAIVDEKNTYLYSKEIYRITDSLQLEERKSKDRFARIQLQTDEIQRENLSLTEENKTIIKYLFILAFFLGIIFLIRYQLIRNKFLVFEQAQQKANEDIYRLIISQQDKLDEGKNLEKSRISKELHDGILGRLFGLRLNLDGLNNSSGEQADLERKSCLEELKFIEQDLREISHELNREKTMLVTNFALILNKLFENQFKINKAHFAGFIDEQIDWNLFSNTIKINLFRIVQECLQNCNKYSKAKNISVSFKKGIQQNIILTIFDDGIGFDKELKSKGIGLTNVIDRVQESNGTIEINTGKNKGTKISISVNVPNNKIKN
jgi:signal transduction histidine kinase